jgi:SAM-dependent methyltransferase
MDAGWPADADVAAESFGYVAVSVSGFLDLMFDLEQALALDPDYRAEGGHLPVSLLDAGCGIGRTLHLIETSGAFPRIDARGIDIVEAYVEHGRTAYGLGRRISQGDCLAFDYSGFDVIYFYRPFSDDAAQEAFETHLVESVTPGTYIAAPLTVALDRSHRLDARGASGQIWKKLG